MRRKKDRCTDKQARSAWLLEVFSYVARGKELSLSDESRRHIAACEDCAASLPEVIERQKAAPELLKSSQMVTRARLGDETIVKRVFKNGIALFEPIEEEEVGRFAFVDSEYRLTLMRGRMSLIEFESWDPQ